MFNHFKYLIEEYWDEIRGNKSSPEGYLNRGKTYIFLGEYEDAVKDFRKATEIAPESHETWYHLGVAHLKLNQIKQAEGAFSNAQKIAPKDFNTMYNLAFCQSELGYFNAAIGQWKMVLSYQKDLWDAYFYRGKMYLGDGKYAAAIRDFLDALAFLPSTKIGEITKCEYFLAKAYLENLEYAKAIEYANKVINAIPNHKDAYFVRALAKKNSGDLKGYEEDLKIAEKHNPFGSLLSDNLEVLIVNKSQGKTPKKANPQSKDYLANAQKHLNSGNFEAAIESLSKVIQADKENSQAYFLRGFAHLQLMNTGKAENDFNMAISLNKMHWQYYSERAKLYDLIGKTESAKKDRRKMEDLKSVR